jgi:hypothetical protein
LSKIIQSYLFHEKSSPQNRCHFSNFPKSSQRNPSPKRLKFAQSGHPTQQQGCQMVHIFSNQKSQFGQILHGLAIEDVGIFY